jgi:carbonic anhydrase
VLFGIAEAMPLPMRGRGCPRYTKTLNGCSGYTSSMEKIFHFDSAPEHYTADAAVLCCFDERVRLVTQKFLKRQGILRPDMIVVAGGAKTLASARDDGERDFVLGQLGLSVRLHGTRSVVLMTHSDCGAYGGLAAFGENAAREADFHQQELQRAASLVKTKFPELGVGCFFVGFDGVHEVSAG